MPSDTPTAELNCPVCGSPPIDAEGFEEAGETTHDGTRFAIFQCWSCNVRFAVGMEADDAEEWSP